LLRQAGYPPPDDFADPVGDGQPELCQVADPFQAALGDQQPDHLSHEQRVAFGAVVDGRHHPFPRYHPGGLLDQAADACFGQAPQPQVPGHRFAGNLRQRDGERVVAVQFHVAVGAQ
jgi:hypothetical protein